MPRQPEPRAPGQEDRTWNQFGSTAPIESDTGSEVGADGPSTARGTFPEAEGFAEPSTSATDPYAPGEPADVASPPDGTSPPSMEPPTAPARTDGGTTTSATVPVEGLARCFREGDTVFDRYILKQKLGRGGMGEVWLVHYAKRKRDTALKVISQEIHPDETWYARFEREAEVMARINHPNAATVIEFDRTPALAYIEMEYIHGRDLKRILRENDDQPMPLDWVARILDQLGDVLQVAHEQQIIHRDLKLSNLMLDESRREGMNLKVLDFGIAKVVEEPGSELTLNGQVLGTPAYISPEQILAESGLGRVDARSDLYSVGVILYELLTGCLPFEGCGQAMMASHLAQPPRPMKVANPDANVPPEVERVVLRCLAKDPAKRPQSAAELTWLFHEAVAASTAPAPVWGRRSVLTGLSVALGTALIGAGGLRFFTNRRPSTGGRPAMTAPRPPSPPRPSLSPRRPAPPAGFDWADSSAPSGEPDLIRESDKFLFRWRSPGVYLPDGYEADNPKDQINDGWPRVIVRTGMRSVRFIRIAGGRYQRGDFRPGSATRGIDPPHWVSVSDFYIQETEVTNREIAAYLDRNPDAPPRPWDNWRQVLDKLETDLGSTETARDCPAACIDHPMAEEYARSVGGRLPTEAEWEFAARSRGLENLWATTAIADPASGPKATLFRGDAASGILCPRPVGNFRKERGGEDETDQGILDLTGNVYEWCQDAYRHYSDIIKDSGADPAHALADPCVRPDPGTPLDQQGFVVRGGSFRSLPEDAFSFHRAEVKAREQIEYLGFRVVIECPRF